MCIISVAKDWQKQQLEKLHWVARHTFTCCREVTFPGTEKERGHWIFGSGDPKSVASKTSLDLN